MTLFRVVGEGKQNKRHPFGCRFFAGWLGNVDGLNDSIVFIKFTNKESIEVKLSFSNFESAVV